MTKLASLIIIKAPKPLRNQFMFFFATPNLILILQFWHCTFCTLKVFGWLQKRITLTVLLRVKHPLDFAPHAHGRVALLPPGDRRRRRGKQRGSMIISTSPYLLLPALIRHMFPPCLCSSETSRKVTHTHWWMETWLGGCEILSVSPNENTSKSSC